LARGHRQREREREDDDDDDDDGKTRVGRFARSVVFVFLFVLLFEEPVWSQISSKSFEIVSDSSSGRAAEL
jgi:hypothetical protein